MDIGVHHDCPIGSPVEIEALFLKTVTGTNLLAPDVPVRKVPHIVPESRGNSSANQPAAGAEVLRQPGDEVHALVHESKVIVRDQGTIGHVDELRVTRGGP